MFIRDNLVVQGTGEVRDVEEASDCCTRIMLRVMNVPWQMKLTKSSVMGLKIWVASCNPVPAQVMLSVRVALQQMWGYDLLKSCTICGT